MSLTKLAEIEAEMQSAVEAATARVKPSLWVMRGWSVYLGQVAEVVNIVVLGGEPEGRSR